MPIFLPASDLQGCTQKACTGHWPEPHAPWQRSQLALSGGYCSDVDTLGSKASSFRFLSNDVLLVNVLTLTSGTNDGIVICGNSVAHWRNISTLGDVTEFIRETLDISAQANILQTQLGWIATWPVDNWTKTICFVLPFKSLFDQEIGFLFLSLLMAAEQTER